MWRRAICQSRFLLVLVRAFGVELVRRGYKLMIQALASSREALEAILYRKNTEQ